MIRTTHPGIRAFTGAVLTLGILAMGAGFQAQGKDLCEASIECINNFWVGDTLDLPSSVVMLSKEQNVCPPTRQPEQPGKVDTISVFIIIDQSGSMKTMDPTKSRYAVAQKLIDSLAARSPMSELGIAIFSNQLMFSYLADPFFTRFDPASASPEAYAPLTRLNTPANVAKLKQILAFSTTPGDTDYYGVQKLVSGFYGPTGRHDGFVGSGANAGYNGTTDISLPFEAAKKAFLTARYTRDQQYIIFISDGEPQNVDLERQAAQNDFVLGTGLPTTFTAFFINQSQPIPQQIQTMTANIAVNGYSTSNSKSEVWKTQGITDDIFAKLINNTINNDPIPSRAISLTINGITSMDFIDSTHLQFQSGFPLQGPVTTFDASFSYQWIGNPPPNFTSKDSTVQFKLVVRTNRGGADSADVTTRCWEQGYIKLYYQGVEITSPIQESQTSIEARYYPPLNEPITSATIRITNARGSDSLILNAANMGAYYTVTFTRAYGSPIVDNILQNGIGDSVVAIYRNSDLPMDVVRTSKPVSGQRNLAIAQAYFLDQDANGIPDLIRVVQTADKIAANELGQIQSYITTKSQRTITIRSLAQNPVGFDVLLVEPTPAPGSVPFTGSFSGEELSIANVPNLVGGGSFPAGTVAIVDSMAPVIASASYLDYSGNEIDTLMVIFSEKVLAVGDPTPFKFSRLSTPEFQLNLMYSRAKGDTLYFSVPNVVGQQAVQFGDSIWIDEIASVSDEIGNKQDNPANIHRLINYLADFTITSAVYIDVDADGLIDIVRVTTGKPIDQTLVDALKSTVTLPSYRNFTIDSLTLTQAGFDIVVTQPATEVPFTKVDDRDSLRVANTVSTTYKTIRPTTIKITDTMPPVIVSAKFSPRNGNTAPDTLVVTLSEDVTALPNTLPFRVVRNGVPVTVIGTLKSGSGSTATYLLTDTSFVPQNNEFKIQINPASNVTDLAGNVQKDEENRLVTLDVGAYPREYTLHVLPGPCDPAVSPILLTAERQGDYNVTASKGLVILIENTKGQATGDTIREVTVSIYDAVGNVIVKDGKGSVGRTGKKASYVWNGENRSGRRVGSGAYVALVVMSDNKGYKKTFRRMLGVKR